MSNETINLLLPSASLMRTYAQSLLSGMTSDNFARKPRSGDVVLDMNTPAFTYGHLSLYPGLVLEMLHLPFSDIKAPESYLGLFKIGSPCHDDPDGARYPKMEEIVGTFSRGYDALLERVPSVSDAVLLEVTPGERVARFPVKGNFLVHLMTSHLASHLGQVSGWRRAMQLPPA